jgi:hypothetical protein
MVLLESAITELSSLTASVTLLPPCQQRTLEMTNPGDSYINEFGFFFFFKMAVAVSSAWVDVSSEASNSETVVFTLKDGLLRLG